MKDQRPVPKGPEPVPYYIPRPREILIQPGEVAVFMLESAPVWKAEIGTGVPLATPPGRLDVRASAFEVTVAGETLGERVSVNMSGACNVVELERRAL